MELTPEQLDAYLEMLTNRGIEEFECEQFHVRFSSYPPTVTTTTVTEQAEAVPQRRSMFEDRRLWNGMEPPTFPKADR